MTAAFKRKHDDAQHQDGPPAKISKENEQQICAICMDELGDQPTIALACGHVFHSDCLQPAVAKAANEAVDTGYVDGQNNTIWRVMPPRCPICRARFVAATYWADLAHADLYPDDGFDFTNTATGTVADDSSSETESDEDSTSAEEAIPAVTGYADDDLSDEEPPAAVGNWVCSQCNQDSTHTEQSAGDFLLDTAIVNPACFICATAILHTDTERVLTCDNCGAPSHYHD